MTGLRALVEAVREARATAGGSRCVHTDPDECCDQCRVAATLNRPVLNGMLAAVRLSEFILSTPDVLAAVEAHPDAMEALEAVRRLGDARAAKRTAQDANYATADAYYDARCDGTGDHAALLDASIRAGKATALAHDAWAAANSTLCAIADRLAARKGE